jgi:hypothetical protein
LALSFLRLFAILAAQKTLAEAFQRSALEAR